MRLSGSTPHLDPHEVVKDGKLKSMVEGARRTRCCAAASPDTVAGHRWSSTVTRPRITRSSAPTARRHVRRRPQAVLGLLGHRRPGSDPTEGGTKPLEEAGRSVDLGFRIERISVTRSRSSARRATVNRANRQRADQIWRRAVVCASRRVVFVRMCRWVSAMPGCIFTQNAEL